jgi:protein transport protein YIF1
MPGFTMPNMADPMAAAAFQYGQVLMGQGTQAMGREFEKYVPVSRLKYYFAVDTGYVVKKLRLLMFPFWHPVTKINRYVFNCSFVIF